MIKWGLCSENLPMVNPNNHMHVGLEEWPETPPYFLSLTGENIYLVDIQKMWWFKSVRKYKKLNINLTIKKGERHIIL